MNFKCWFVFRFFFSFSFRTLWLGCGGVFFFAFHLGWFFSPDSVVQFQKTYLLFVRWEIKTLLIIILSLGFFWHAFASTNQFAYRCFDLSLAHGNSSVFFQFIFLNIHFIVQYTPHFIFKYIFKHSSHSINHCKCVAFEFASIDWNEFRLFTVCCIQLEIFPIWWNST